MTTTAKSWFFAAVCALLIPSAASAFELRMAAFEPKAPSVSLLDDAPQYPASMRTAVASEVASALDASAQGFVSDVERVAANDQDMLAGGGQAAPDNAWLAFLLGLIPGFGLGHYLIANDSPGGTKWLIVDIIFIVVWILLDAVVFPLAFYGAYGLYFLWTIIDILLPIGWIVEHVFQGLDAYKSATGRKLVGDALPAVRGNEFAQEPGRATPNVFSFGF